MEVLSCRVIPYRRGLVSFFLDPQTFGAKIKMTPLLAPNGCINEYSSERVPAWVHYILSRVV